MVRRVFYIILFLAVLPATPSFAQFSISGRVLNDDNLLPIGNANVFLTGTSIGNKTAADGTFKLSGIKQGKYALVVSFVGFKSYRKDFLLNADTSLGDIDIQPKIVALKEIVIKPEKHRDYDLEVFIREFIGTSALAGDCKILNPDVLTLHYDDDADTLSGSSSDFLVIENKALGYTVKYQVDNFFVNNKSERKRDVSYNGSVLFEKMKGTPAEEARWEKKRRQVYENSSMHFLRAVLDDDLERQGFQVLQLNANVNYDRPPDSIIQAKLKYYKKASRNDGSLRDSLTYWQEKWALPRLIKEYVPIPQNKNDIFKPTDLKGIFAIYSNNHNAGLEIFYSKEKHFRQVFGDETSLLNFKKTYAFFDYNGTIVNPKNVLITGAWARNRVAELLPSDYEPEDSTE